MTFYELFVWHGLRKSWYIAKTHPAAQPPLEMPFLDEHSDFV